MRQCLFCSETKLTREHIWPNWLVEAFKRLHPNQPGYSVRQWRRGERIGSFSADLEHKARVVCKTCNGGWMSALEAAAKPELSPFVHVSELKMQLSVEAQVILTAWTTLRAMVFESLLPVDQRFFTQSDREQFKAMIQDPDPFELPTKEYVWLVMLGGAEKNARLNVTTRPRDNEHQTIDIHLANISIGQAYLQLLAWRHGVIEEYLPRAPHHEVATQIWPSPTVDLLWPPNYHLDVENWVDFAERFFPIPGIRDRTSSHGHDEPLI